MNKLYSRIILHWVLFMLPFTAMCVFYYHTKADRYMLLLEKEQEKKLEIQAQSLSQTFITVHSQINTISELSYTKQLFSTDAGQRNASEDYFNQLINSAINNFSIFYKAILVDNSGKLIEVVEVADSNQSVAKKFCDLSHMKLYTSLKEGESFISKINLDSTECRKKPYLRVLTPIFDQNKRLGFAIFYIDASTIVNRFGKAGVENGWKNVFVRNDGVFELMPNTTLDFVKSEPIDSSNHTHLKYQKIRKSIGKKTSGKELGQDGLYVFYQLHTKKLHYSGIEEMDGWLIVSFISNKTINKGILSQMTGFELFSFSILFIFLTFIAFLLAESIHRQRNTREQLIASERDLIKANKTKNKFISVLAHDLKNPVASIIGFIDILKNDYDTLPDSFKQKSVTLVENSAHLLIKLIDDILTWARGINGNIVVSKDGIPVLSKVQDAIKYAELQANNKRIKFNHSLDPELFVYADPTLLETVLRNVLSNAIKYSKPDSSVDISGVVNGDFVELNIQDYGVGMDEEVQSKVFDLEYLTSTKGTNNEKGTGLGLIICKDFMLKNDGDITFTSELNKGTTFTLFIPVYQFNL